MGIAVSRTALLRRVMDMLHRSACNTETSRWIILRHHAGSVGTRRLTFQTSQSYGARMSRDGIPRLRLILHTKEHAGLCERDHIADQLP